MTWWERLAEERIRAAQAEGAFDHLPQGAPLPPDDPPWVPQEWRLAWKVLRNNDLAPPWVLKRRALLADIATWRQALAQARHPAAHQRLQAEMEALNRRIRDYNLEAPHPVWHLPFLRWESAAPDANGAATTPKEEP